MTMRSRGLGLAVGAALLAACTPHSQAQTQPAATAQPRQAAGQPASGQQSLVIDHTCVDAQDRVIPQEALDRARRLKVVWAHQSVGWDVIRGLEAMSNEQRPRYGLRIQHQITQYGNQRWFDQNAGLGEFFFGGNGDPPAKARTFEQAMRDGLGQRVNVAIFKYCFADFQDRTDVAGAWQAMRETYERLQQAYPQVRFVWVTVPPVVVTRLGDKRTAMNRSIREYVTAHGQTLLDLSAIESHTPDGQANVQQGVELLCQQYARDQGHPNDYGAKRIGRAYWWLLARIAGWSGPAS